MTSQAEIAIIGAGPYGLSLAAHLAAHGIPFRIFGRPLESWRRHMPKGMLLKSDGFASSLSAPTRPSRLEDFCATSGLPYANEASPVPLDRFVAYGDWFQKRFVPDLDTRYVTALSKNGDVFGLVLEDGERIKARHVVVSAGITWFAHRPLGKDISRDLLSHSFDHHDVSGFTGREVVVIGAGASAIDTAGALHEVGASVQIVTRRGEIAFNSGPKPRTLLDYVRNPPSGIGPGWRSFVCAKAPLLFHSMPESLRLRAVERHLGPAPAWFMRARIEGHVPTLFRHTIRDVRGRHDRVELVVAGTNGQARTIMADHVIAATGYRPALKQLPFLADNLQARITSIEDTPILSSNFESSIDGLYFMGLAAANSFGPLLRFMVGAEYAAPKLAAHLRHKAQSTSNN